MKLNQKFTVILQSLISLLVLTLATACGDTAVDRSAGSPSTESSTPTVEETGPLATELQSRLLTTLDMPNGWSASDTDSGAEEPEPTPGSGSDSECATGSPHIPVPTAQALAVFTQSSKSLAQALEIPVDRKTESARTVFTAYKDYFNRCPAIIINDENTSVQPADYPEFGDESVAFHLGGKMDGIIVRVGNTVASFVYYSPFYLNDRTSQDLVRRGVSKLQ